MDTRSSQLLRGTLDILILKMLAGGPLHGYGITTRIAAETDEVIDIEDGALYQALHRMEERGSIESAWGHAENGKRARFYRLTPAGRKQLRVETASWMRYAAAVMKVLQPEG
ncbi:MAG TPA: PadR family transcriptional regulator [Thermoanaerobaculia bacterium]|nr:PadR family transcriptional regulator [Thermoanaerobaculia bacterium]